MLDELREWLRAMHATQHAWTELLRVQRQLLTQARLSQYQSLIPVERQLQSQLEQLALRRKAWLQQAAQQGFGGTLMCDVAAQMGPEGAAIVPEILSLTAGVRALQQDVWVVWVLANRCASYYSGAVELLATRGHRAATYERPGQRAPDAQAVLLDRAA